MSPQHKRSTVSPTLLAFGKRFRRFREAKGWSQENAAARAKDGEGVAPQYIGAIENGRTRCTRDFAETMDKELAANGDLLDLWDELVKEAVFPTWFDWAPIETDSIMLQGYEPLVMHGLLQTRAYATAMLGGNTGLADARLARQAVLSRSEPDPPHLAVLLDRVVLERQVGGIEVMREQLSHLLSMSELPNVTIQIVPSDGAHDGNAGAFTVATLSDRSVFAYAEMAARGLTLNNPDELARLERTLIQIRALALPVTQSIEIIHRTAEERWK